MPISDPPTGPFDHPYRSAFEVPALEVESLRLPYTGQARMRLAVSSGLAYARIVIDPHAADLIAVQCGDGPPPRLRVGPGEVAIRWKSALADWLRGAGRDVVIVLHPGVEWALALHGGLSHTALDLAAGTVARIDLHGGCSNVRVELPRPTAIVPVRITGGASHLSVQRPADAGVALAVAGGVAKLHLDDQRLGAIGGATRLDTRNVTPGAPHYELQINGGAADLSIERAPTTAACVL